MTMNKATSILIVMHGAGRGGVEKSLKTLCKYLDRSRVQVTVALPSGGPLKDDLDVMDIRSFVTPIDTWTPIPFDYGERHYFQFLTKLNDRVSALVDIIRREKIDVVHSATLSVADGAFAARLAAKPHVWHIHGKSVGTTNAYGSYLPVETLYALVKELSAKVVAVSDDTAHFLEGYGVGYCDAMIYNGIDLQDFDSLAATPSGIREEFGLSGKKLISWVGRIASVKGVEDYIETAATVLKKRDDTVFLVVGADEDRELANKVRERVKAMNLADRIVFTGRRNDIPSLLKESELYVCSSKTEGFSYSILEAMSAAKPTVSTRCGGPEELVVDGETGFLTDVGKPNRLADAVTLLLEDEALMKKMGRMARVAAEEKFSAEIYAGKFEDLYRSLAGDTGAEKGPWPEVLLNMLSTVGDLGGRIRQLEHEVRDLRNFEARLKDNAVYRGIKKLAGVFGR
jgi:glycosyltransferase involved in cell wall biosynthesis